MKKLHRTVFESCYLWTSSSSISKLWKNAKDHFFASEANSRTRQKVWRCFLALLTPWECLVERLYQLGKFELLVSGPTKWRRWSFPKTNHSSTFMDIFCTYSCKKASREQLVWENWQSLRNWWKICSNQCSNPVSSNFLPYLPQYFEKLINIGFFALKRELRTETNVGNLFQFSPAV